MASKSIWSRLLLSALFTFAVPFAWADTTTSNISFATLNQKPLPSGVPSDELIVMLCRRGLEPGQLPQQMPQELPLLCLVMQTDGQALQMGPERFQELLDKAANSGMLTVLLLQPQKR